MNEIKSFANDTAKQIWRTNMIDFVRANSSKNYLRNAKILCLTGKELLESDTWIEAGVKPRNIITLEDNPKELNQLIENNESRPQRERIHIKPMSAFDYFAREPIRHFDILSLDYCGYLDEDKLWTIEHIFGQGWLKPNSFLFTNYLQAREGENTQLYYSRIEPALQTMLNKSEMSLEELAARTADEFRLFQKDNAKSKESVTNENPTTENLNLAKYRELLAQITPILSATRGTSLAKTKVFRQFLELEDEKTREMIELSLKENKGLLGDMAERYFISRMSSLENQLLDNIFSYLTHKETKKFEIKNHESYKYVSDSGQPMISDFYALKKFNLKINPKLARSFRTMQDFENVRLKIILIDPENVFKLSQSMQEYKDLIFHSLYKARANLPKERIIINTNTQSNPDPVKSTTEKLSSEQKAGLYKQIGQGLPDDELMETYNLSKMQLAGHKAAYKRANGGSNLEEKTLFEPEDEKVISELLEEGYKATEIAELFDGKCNWQKIAAYKARIGNGNGDLFEKIKSEILERDNYTCINCGRTNQENLELSRHGLHVHHIDYNDENTVKENLVSLCTSCHAKSNLVQHAEAIRSKLEEYIADIYKQENIFQS